jgi:hypothetical protein
MREELKGNAPKANIVVKFSVAEIRLAKGTK